MTPVCGHDAPPYGPPLCAHIRSSRAKVLDHYTWYTGAGTNSARICGDCRALVDSGAVAAVEQVCEDCFDDTEGDLLGAAGRPEVLDRPREFDRRVVATPVPPALGPAEDLAPVAAAGVTWLVLCADGRIVRWNCDTGEWAEEARTTVEVPADAEPYCGRAPSRRLIASADGRFAAVVVDHANQGEVFDLSTGAVTLTLDGGTYHNDTVPFSAAFAGHDGRTVLIHRTEWNRLDLSDPATGELLTAREFEPGEDPRSERVLDYFHGGLTVSPTGVRIADDGWVWAPVGVVTAWNLRDWVAGNPFESEDGPSRTELPGCLYHWNRPVVWLDDDRLVVGGIGEDDYEIVGGARIFDVGGAGSRPAGHRPAPVAPEVMTFGGPEGRFFAAGGLLFSSDSAGLKIWDPADGSRLGAVEGFSPTHHHPAAGELVALTDEHLLLRWRLPLDRV
ncbi:hypothetical protein ACIPSA_28400 [Streptomyces sp. NPDC086549]|uniref:hypothetical protein n=1 Tax=Streptomyces sp. NPDC086549 TaxID=3365752 RepID=UPI00381914FA